MGFSITICQLGGNNILPNQVLEYNSKDSHQVNIYEYIFYLYRRFNLEIDDVETIIPQFYSNTINLIIKKYYQANEINNHKDFLSKCNITNFDGILKRVTEQFKFNESLNHCILRESLFIVNSNNFTNFEKLVLDFLRDINHENIIGISKDGKYLKIDINSLRDHDIINHDIYQENNIVRIFLSYLAITVNIRDQLRFAQIFNVPERKLNHHAFTHLRHESEAQNLSMGQVAVSFVAKIKYKSKSYAPATDYPLNKYIYGLSELVELINKLQSIMEEMSVKSDKVMIIRKMLTAIQSALHQDKTNKFKKNQMDFIKDKIIENVRRIMSQEIIKVFNYNLSPYKQIIELIRFVLADYAIQPEAYFDSSSSLKLGTPTNYKTPKGGCSSKISVLFMSPNTCDSPIFCNTKKDKIVEFENESESMPEYPLFCKYQSDINWLRNNFTPPNIVQQISLNVHLEIPPPDLNDDSVDAEIFNDISSVPDLSMISKTIEWKKNFEKSAAISGQKQSVTKGNKVQRKRSSVNESRKRKIKPAISSNQKLITSFFSCP